MTAADEASPDGDLGTVGLDAEPDGGQADAPPLVVHGQGGTVTLSPGQVYVIGRDPAADVVVDAPVVSWQHAQLLATAGQWLIQDAGSTNGTFCGGLPVRRMQITGDCPVPAWPPGGRPAAGPARSPMPRPAGRVGAGPAPAAHAATALWPGHPAGDRQPTGITRVLDRALRIGRADDSNVVIRDLQVSRRHAELRGLGGGRFQLTDTGSATAPSSTASGSPPRWSPRPT